MLQVLFPAVKQGVEREDYWVCHKGDRFIDPVLVGKMAWSFCVAALQIICGFGKSQ